MKCRTDIIGQKIWIDNDNAYNTRPATTKITLLRDGVEFDSRTLTKSSSGIYRFLCLVTDNGKQDYVYQIDEIDVPEGYTKTFQGNNIINTLNSITISGQKIWDDNYNDGGKRPDNVTVRLYRNGVEIDTQTVAKPLDTEDTVNYTFGEAPFMDPTGTPYVYTVDEDDVAQYKKTIKGFNIINTISATVP